MVTDQYPLSIAACLFDLDGTLIDSREDIAASVNYALENVGCARKAVEQISGYIGDGVTALMCRALGPQDDELIDDALKLFHKHYAAHCLDRTTLYPGVEEMLRMLDDMPKAIVTNKPTDYSHTILDGLGVGRHFRVVVGGDVIARKKPNPAQLLDALAAMDVSPKQACLVGDSHIDVLAGQRAGTWTCGALYGLGDPQQLQAAGPDFVIHSIDELCEYIH